MSSFTPTGAPRAAARWLDPALGSSSRPALLVLVGLGGPDLVDALDPAPALKVLAIEPDATVAGAVLADPRARQWQSTGRLTILTGPDYAGADEAWRLFPRRMDAHKVLTNPALPRDDRGAAASAVAKRIVFGVRANADARRRFAPRYLTNTLRNLPGMLAGRSVSALENHYAGVPAIVVAAGPSLDAAIDDLRVHAGRAVVIAVNTALRPLLDAGITPPLTVAIDPGAATLRHFDGLPDTSRTWLVSEAAVDRRVTEAFDGRTFWYRAANHEPWPWLVDLGLEAMHLEVWGSVLTAAFQVACLAGCDPIVTLGADLAFTGGRPYCRGTTYEFDWAHAIAMSRPVEDVWVEQMSRGEVCRAPDVHGGETISSRALTSVRDWLVARAARSGRRVVNASGAGIFGGGRVEQMPLAAIGLPPRAIAPLPDATGERPVAALRAAIGELRRNLHSPDVSPVVSRWMDFVGDGFDADAVAAALDEVVPRLAGVTTTGARARPLPPDPLLTSLPERVLRYRRALEGQWPDAVDPLAAGRALGAAVERLDSLRDAIADVAMTPFDTALLGRIPSSASFDWPEACRHEVIRLEGLLGHAYGRPAPAPGAPQVEPIAHLRQEWRRCLETVPAFVPPRLLSLEGVPASFIGYAASDDVICVMPHSPHSFRLDARGRMRPHLVWPRPITGLLPFGEGGAIAWSNGGSFASHDGGYVMIRESADADAVVHDLPIRPSIARWWRGRLYFNCYPYPARGNWVGVASWLPGEEPVRELDDLILFGMVDRGAYLELHPMAFGERGYEPTLQETAWTWAPGEAPVPFALGVLGSIADHAPADGTSWHAIAFPQSDAVLLRREHEVIALRVPSPSRLVWIGSSLLVGTMTRELLLYPDLLARLDDAC